MKNKRIMLSLILIMTVSLVALAVGWHKFNGASENPNLIACKNHIDSDFNMACDNCGFIISRKYELYEKEIEVVDETGVTTNIAGNMPKESKLSSKKIQKNDAVKIAKNKNLNVKEEDILLAYDMSISVDQDKYQPAAYNEEVSVSISNLDIDPNKSYAILHIKDDGSIETLNITEMDENQIKFNTRSFSTYIIISINSYNVSFTEDSAYKGTAYNGVEIKAGDTFTEVSNFNFLLEASEGYFIKSITLVNESGVDRSSLLEIGGTSLRRTCNIVAITENLIVNVETATAPEIVVGVAGKKVSVGSEVTFSITTENTTTYEWQYKVRGDDTWQNASAIGSVSSSNGVSELTINSVTTEMNGYLIRCLLGNDECTGDNRIASIDATLLVEEGTENLSVYSQNMSDASIEIIYEVDVGSMITEWTITEDNTEIKLPVTGIVDLVVNWGDGNYELISGDITEENLPTHTYEKAGIYDIDISGTCGAWGLNNVYVNASGEMIPITEDKPYYTQAMYLTGLKQWGELGVTRYGFSYCEKLKFVSGDATENTFDNVTDMSYMFYNCSALTSFNVNNFNTSNVTNMHCMFYYCNELTSVDVSNFDTSSVESMRSMFNGCSALTSIDASNFDTSSVESMRSMFNGCSALTSIDVSKFDTSKVIDMYCMFYNCSSLMSIDVSNFDTSQVTIMDAMFFNCSTLTSLDLSSFNTSNVISMPYMFQDATSLASILISNKFVTPSISGDGMFTNTPNLTAIIITSTETNGNQFASAASQLDGKTFYVPNDSEDAFETAFEASFDASKVEPILKLVGEKNILLIIGDTYTDNGYTVAGFTPEELNALGSGDENLFGYNVTKVGDVDTTIEGSYPVSYTLTRTYISGDTTITTQPITEIRKVDVIDGRSYMITEWRIPVGGTTIYLPVTGAVDIEVEWGDNSPKEQITGTYTAETMPKHEYSEARDYNIIIRGTIDNWGISTNESSNVDSSTRYYPYTQYLIGLKQWGELGATNYGFSYCENLEYVLGNATENTFKNVNNMSSMFNQCTGLTNLNLTGFTTSDVTNMSYMFNGCSALTSLDLSSFDTSNVTSMNSMFLDCSSLTELDVSNFNTSEVLYFQNMFYGCRLLTTLELKNFDTSSVTNMERMFYECNALTSFDLSSFNTFNVTDMSSMFYQCNSIQNLDLSNFNTSNVTDMNHMFTYCNSMTSLNISSFDTSNVTDMKAMFNVCSSLTSLDVSKFKTGNVTDMSFMFALCDKLTKLDVSGFDTAKVMDMGNMFDSCSSLTSISTSKFDTTYVTNMQAMFNKCGSLTDVDVSSFNTSNVTLMNSMFYDCSLLKNIDVSKFNTEKVTDMGYMFRGCSALQSIDVSEFNTANVTDMRSMFNRCSSLSNIDLSNFDTSKVADMAYMLRYNSNLKSIHISNKFIISGDATGIIEGCDSSIKFITTSAVPVENQFKGIIPNTSTLYVPNDSLDNYIIVLDGEVENTQIKPIIQLVGDEKLIQLKGRTYEEKGYTVAGFTIKEVEQYMVYGYDVEMSGDIDINTVGEYQIAYRLTRTYSGDTITEEAGKVTRIVAVYDAPVVILYENNEIYDGEWTNQDIVAKLKLLSNQSTWVAVKVGYGEWSVEPSYADIEKSGDEITVTFAETLNGTVYIREVDALGNATTYATAGNIVKIDKENPQINETKAVTEDKIIKIKAEVEDKESGISAYAVTTENVEPTEWKEQTTSEIVHAVPSSGTYYLWVKDKAGNVVNTEVSALRDVTAPKGLIEIEWTNVLSGDNFGDIIVVAPDIISGEKYTNQEIVTINILVTDNETEQERIMFALYDEEDYAKVKNGEQEIEWKQYTPEYQWPLKEAQGENVIYAIFKDVAGNVSIPIEEIFNLR